MILVGLTGGTGCGKSRVATIFKQLGCHIIDADQIARIVTGPGKPVLGKIRSVFGRSVLTRTGSLDRKRLGALIFSHPGMRKRLNAIIHPYIFREEERIRRRIALKNPGAVVVFDAALLIETGSYRLMDRNILVTADRKTQLSRIMKRDGLSRQDALKRIRAQWPAYRKKKYADYQLDGRLPAGRLRAKVRRIYNELNRLPQPRGKTRRLNRH